MRYILTLGEKLNNMTGSTIKTIKEISKHDFFVNSIAMNNNTNEIYALIARILFYKKGGIENESKEEILKFVKCVNFDINSKEYEKIIKCLDYLVICFPKKYCYSYDEITKKEYYLFEKSTLILSTFTFIDTLMQNDCLNDIEEEIKKYIYNLHIMSSCRIGNFDMQCFFDSLKSGWSKEKNIV